MKDSFANYLKTFLQLGNVVYENSEISIFTEKEERKKRFFLVKGIDNILRLTIHNVRIGTQ